MVLKSSSVFTGSSPNEAMAMELPNASKIQRTCAAGSIARLVASSLRSWLSRGRNISRYSPSVTGSA
jgi:hypothetical protein